MLIWMPSTRAILLFLLLDFWFVFGFFFKLILLVRLNIDTLIHDSLNISIVNLYNLSVETQ